MKPITNTLVVEGSPAKFTAEYSGEPPPDVTWLRNALQVLQETRNIKVNEYLVEILPFLAREKTSVTS